MAFDLYDDVLEPIGNLFGKLCTWKHGFCCLATLCTLMGVTALLFGGYHFVEIAQNTEEYGDSFNQKTECMVFSFSDFGDYCEYTLIVYNETNCNHYGLNGRSPKFIDEGSKCNAPKVGVVPCYTNDYCDGAYLEAKNMKHAIAGQKYFIAALFFIFSLAALLCLCYFCYRFKFGQQF
eukprot:522368_1